MAFRARSGGQLVAWHCRELSPAERAIHIAKRKAIYERMHGPAKANSARGANRAMGRNVSAKSALASFTKDTAEKTGRSKRSVQVDAARARSIPRIAEVIPPSASLICPMEQAGHRPDEWPALRGRPR